jgi:hypothetical protein
LTYQGARAVVVKAGNLVGIHPWPRPVLSKCGDGRAGIHGPAERYHVRMRSH